MLDGQGFSRVHVSGHFSLGWMASGRVLGGVSGLVLAKVGGRERMQIKALVEIDAMWQRTTCHCPCSQHNSVVTHS